MKVNDIISHRGKKYKVKKITKTKSKYVKNMYNLKAYLKPYGWDGENRIAVIKNGKVREFEKKHAWGYSGEYYKTW